MGNLQLCDNWRGISLLSVPGNIFGRVIANCVQKLAETLIDEAQCGFRKMRGCNDMVFVDPPSQHPQALTGGFGLQTFCG